MEAQCLWLKQVQTEKPRHQLIQTRVKEAARVRGRRGQARTEDGTFADFVRIWSQDLSLAMLDSG